MNRFFAKKALIKPVMKITYFSLAKLKIVKVFIQMKPTSSIYLQTNQLVVKILSTYAFGISTV